MTRIEQRLKRVDVAQLMDEPKHVHGTDILYIPSILQRGLTSLARVEGAGCGDTWNYANPKPLIMCCRSKHPLAGMGNTHIVISPTKVESRHEDIITPVVTAEAIDGIVYEDRLSVPIDVPLRGRLLECSLFDEMIIDGEKYLIPQFTTTKSWQSVKEFIRITHEKSPVSLVDEVVNEIATLEVYNHNRGDIGIAQIAGDKLYFSGKTIPLISDPSRPGKIGREKLPAREFDFRKWEYAFELSIRTLGFDLEGTLGDMLCDMSERTSVPIYFFQGDVLCLIDKRDRNTSSRGNCYARIQ